MLLLMTLFYSLVRRLISLKESVDALLKTVAKLFIKIRELTTWFKKTATYQAFGKPKTSACRTISRGILSTTDGSTSASETKLSLFTASC